MFDHYKSLGIILTEIDIRESDKILVVYTKDFGKVEVLAKAIRKIDSKLKSGIELFSLVEVSFIEGKTGKILTDCCVVNAYKNIKKDIGRISVAYKIAYSINKLIKGQEPDNKTWLLVEKIFDTLNDLETKSSCYFLIYYYFLWNFLDILGYRPELYKCFFCQKELSPDSFYFLSDKGGVSCASCFKKEELGIKITPEIIKILRIFLEKDKEFSLKIKINPIEKKLLQAVSESCLKLS